MSRDPFEELFGPLADDAGDQANGTRANSETPTAPMPTPKQSSQPGEAAPGVRRGQNGQAVPSAVPAVTAPLPARQRLAHEQAERVHTSQPSSSLPQGPKRSAKSTRALPWIIVAAVAIAAIIVSIVVVNIARGADNATEASSDTSTSESTTQQPEPTPDSPATTQPDEPKPEEKPKDDVPQVEVGPTSTMQIGPWNATSELSQRLGSASFYIPDGTTLELTTDLLSSFPESCKDLRSAWGATRLEDGTFQLRKPTATCAEASELYDTVWGLMSAWVDTIKPM